MKSPLLLLLILVFVPALFAYEIPDENEYVSQTCRISVKVTVIPDEAMTEPTGRAVVTATLTDDEGNPQRQMRLTIKANAGTFMCTLPGDSTTSEESSSDECFSTGYDGIARLYLVNIPLNAPIKVTASYDCDGNAVSSFATMSISRGKVKHKQRVRPRVR